MSPKGVIRPARKKCRAGLQSTVLSKHIRAYWDTLLWKWQRLPVRPSHWSIFSAPISKLVNVRISRFFVDTPYFFIDSLNCELFFGLNRFLIGTSRICSSPNYYFGVNSFPTVTSRNSKFNLFFDEMSITAAPEQVSRSMFW